MILYTSDINTCRSSYKTALVYLLISIFVAIFGAIYELFSHEVYSYYMIYAFAFPLIGGVFPFLTVGLFKPNLYPQSISRNLYHSGIGTLTVGGIIQGILEIYGTTNSMMIIYWGVGAGLTICGILGCLIRYIH